MKNKLVIKVITCLLILGFLFHFSLKAQNINSYITDLNAVVTAVNYENSKNKLLQFIQKNNIVVLTQNETESDIYIIFNAKEKEFKQIDSIINYLGYISSKNISTVNNNERINVINQRIDYLQNQKKEYNVEIQKMNRDNKYYIYWEKMREIDKEILDLSKELRSYNALYNYKVSITLRDDENSLNSGKMSFVNMPGAAYDILFVESPVDGKTCSKYAGYSIKYLFTKGKSYVKIGSLKAVSQPAGDSTSLTELFIYAFGADYYTKHFGRGKNKWFNIYSAFNVGGIYGTSKNEQTHIFYLQLFLGIEIFKSKFVLLDNKAGYFVPFGSYNRNLRGFTYEISLNFVF